MTTFAQTTLTFAFSLTIAKQYPEVFNQSYDDAVAKTKELSRETIQTEAKNIAHEMKTNRGVQLTALGLTTILSGINYALGRAEKRMNIPQGSISTTVAVCALTWPHIKGALAEAKTI